MVGRASAPVARADRAARRAEVARPAVREHDDVARVRGSARVCDDARGGTLEVAHAFQW